MSELILAIAIAMANQATLENELKDINDNLAPGQYELDISELEALNQNQGE